MLDIDVLLQNRYRIVRLLGQGGMGAVYEAIDERFGEPIALKEILVGLAVPTDEGQRDLMVKAFEREAKSLAKAKHEAVPFVRDYFSELDRQFLVMELVEGDDLAATLVKRNKPFPLDDGMKWIDQLLDALDYLHNLKPPIIHRDIKPHNLKVNSRGKIKLLDFGIAKNVDTTTATVTNQTFVGATLNYSPIEQILRVIDPTFREYILLKHKDKAERILGQTTDPRCDVFALGATFYHFFTNCPPTDVVKRTLEIWEGKEDPLPVPSELNPEIPRLISDCLVRAMEVERDKRFSSAAEMREALELAFVKEKDRSYAGKSSVLHEENALPAEAVGSTQRPTDADTERLLPVVESRNASTSSPLPKTSPSPLLPSSLPLSDFESLTDDEFESRGAEELGVERTLTEDPSLIAPDSVLPETDLKTVSMQTPYLGEQLSETRDHQSENIPDSGKESVVRHRAKSIWIVALAAIGVVFALGTGGILWIGMSESKVSDKPETNTVVSTPDATPAATPTEESNSLQFVSPTPQPTQPDSVRNEEQPIQPVGPVQKKPVKLEAGKPPPRKTPPPRQNPNCIFNNSCK